LNKFSHNSEFKQDYSQNYRKSKCVVTAVQQYLDGIQRGGWRSKNSSSTRIASMIERFKLSAAIVARLVAVKLATSTPFQSKGVVG